MSGATPVLRVLDVLNDMVYLPIRSPTGLSYSQSDLIDLRCFGHIPSGQPRVDASSMDVPMPRLSIQLDCQHLCIE